MWFQLIFPAGNGSQLEEWNFSGEPNVCDGQQQISPSGRKISPVFLACLLCYHNCCVSHTHSLASSVAIFQAKQSTDVAESCKRCRGYCKSTRWQTFAEQGESECSIISSHKNGKFRNFYSSLVQSYSEGSFVWRNLSHLTEINIGGNYARKQQKCETVISDVAGRLEWGGRGNVYVISREC
jgi:hypothetical protein